MMPWPLLIAYSLMSVKKYLARRDKIPIPVAQQENGGKYIVQSNGVASCPEDGGVGAGARFPHSESNSPLTYNMQRSG